MAWAARFTFGNNADVPGDSSLLAYLLLLRLPMGLRFTQQLAGARSAVQPDSGPTSTRSSGTMRTISSWVHRATLERRLVPLELQERLNVSATQQDPNEVNFGDGNNGPSRRATQAGDLRSGLQHHPRLQWWRAGTDTRGCATSWATPATAEHCPAASITPKAGTPRARGNLAFVPSEALLKTLSSTRPLTWLASPATLGQRRARGLPTRRAGANTA